jgi:hypothetical protein
MPGSVTSAFTAADDFAAALCAEGVLSLLVTGRAFRARLTQVALHRLRLSATEEYLPRIAHVGVPTDMILVALPYGSGLAPIWGGTRMRAGEIITLRRVSASTREPTGLAAGARSGCRPRSWFDMAARERTKSNVDIQNRDNGRRDGLRHGSHRVSYIYPDRDLSCGGKSGGVRRHGCGQREHP